MMEVIAAFLIGFFSGVAWIVTIAALCIEEEDKQW